jgi:hypothetical protein
MLNGAYESCLRAGNKKSPLGNAIWLAYGPRHLYPNMALKVVLIGLTLSKPYLTESLINSLSHASGEVPWWSNKYFLAGLVSAAAFLLQGLTYWFNWRGRTAAAQGVSIDTRRRCPPLCPSSPWQALSAPWPSGTAWWG